MAPRHYTGIDGLIESVPASLEERKKQERKGLRKNRQKKVAEAGRCRYNEAWLSEARFPSIKEETGRISGQERQQIMNSSFLSSREWRR